MKCKHKDCSTCPYEDCIASQTEIMSSQAKKKKKSARSEYDKQYYQEHREEKKASALARYYRGQKRGNH